MFDVYIFKMPRLSLIADQLLNQHLQHFTKDDYDFWLGLPRDYTAGAHLVTTIEKAHGLATLAREEYKTPVITQAIALEIARTEFERLQLLVQREYESPLVWKQPRFDPACEDPRVWVFFCGSPTLQGMGLIPGGLNVLVDKLSGEIISSEDFAKANDDIRTAGGVKFIL